MIQTNPTNSPMCCKIQTNKTNSSQSYSVQSLLNQTDEIDNSVLDLSIKEKRQRSNNDLSISIENQSEIENNEKMKKYLLNAIQQQKELQNQTNRKFYNQNIDFLQTTKSNLDSLQKFCNPIGNLPWNFIRSPTTNINESRRNTSQSLNNFQTINETTNLSETARFSTYLNPPSNSSQSSHSDETPGDPKRYTLTPIHLRKAKLMFLYTRYPNSQMLKSYFPDITFYKQNTAQLVKWFSNFREFYYSEMEKAVQRAVSNGIQHAKDIDVTVDSELFKNLMTHFNKKKQIVVPCEFLTTVQITLREFFDAISAGKNLHQSWKKPIYKTIAKLDQMLPEFFKDMNWMMELAKDENDSLNS